MARLANMLMWIELIDYMETCLAIAAAHKQKGSSLEEVLKDPAFPRPDGLGPGTAP